VRKILSFTNVGIQRLAEHAFDDF